MARDPVLIAYGVKRRGRAQRPRWQRIGEAYPHHEGAGLTLLLNVLPLDGRIILLERDAEDDARLVAEDVRLAVNWTAATPKKRS